MVSDEGLNHLARALAKLRAGHDATAPWSALRDLGAAGRAGLPFTVDLRASEILGAPLVVLGGRDRAIPPHWRLTPREAVVAGLIRSGHSNKAIARALKIALGTVKDHVHHILRKSGAPSRAALIAGLAG